MSPLLNAEVQGNAISVFAQDWSSVVDYHLREPGDYLPHEQPTGYLPPLEVADPPDQTIPMLETLSLQYWLKPPHEVATDPPDAEDRLTLKVQVNP